MTEYEEFVFNNSDLINQIFEADFKVKEEQLKLDKLKEKLLVLMDGSSIDKLRTSQGTVVFIDSSIGTRLDSAKFKKDYPKLFMEYSNSYIKREYIMLRR